MLPYQIFIIVICVLVSLGLIIGLPIYFTRLTSTTSPTSTTTIIFPTITPIQPITFIPNTIVFDSLGWSDGKQTGTDNQAKVDEVYELQKNNEFGNQRYALLFQPGTYNIVIKVGYYTQVLGLGLHSDEVTIIGNVESLQKGTGTSPGYLDQFWRGCENICVIPPNSDGMLWGVSQACHLRNVHVKGNLSLAIGQGFSSGGFMSDCQVDGDIFLGTQQQFFIRNCTYNNIYPGAWNFVLMGNTGSNAAPSQDCVEEKILFNVINETPIIAAKPYIVYENDSYHIIKPDVLANQSGLLPTTGSIVISPDEVYVANQDSYDINDMNSALAAGKHIILSPGFYQLSSPLLVTQSNTIILGLGLATLQPINGNVAIVVSNDALGVRLAGFMIQAGDTNSDFLVQVGTSIVNGSSTNPSVLSDVFCRVGGPLNGDNEAVTTMIEINQSHSLMDGNWLWRADHNAAGSGSGLGPTKAVVKNCLIVNADHVSTYGLHSEHALENLILWNGNNGSMYFLQSELAYDVGNLNPAWDFAGLKINNSVTDFYGIGIGIYSFFANVWGATETTPSVSSGIESPEGSGIVIKSGMSLLLNANSGGGQIRRVINQRGVPSNRANADKPIWCSLNFSNFCACSVNP